MRQAYFGEASDASATDYRCGTELPLTTGYTEAEIPTCMIRREFRMRHMALLLCSASLIGLTGCAGQGYHGTTTPPVQQSEAGGFGWETQALEATGTAKPSNTLREPQRSVTARRAAKTDSISRLKEQVSILPVVNGQTLGNLMQDNLGLRHAVENYLQKAQVLNEGKGTAESFEAHVRLPLAPLAEILERYQFTPSSAPELVGDESTVAPVS